MKVKVPNEVAAAARAIAREVFRDACRVNGQPFDPIMAIRAVEATWTKFLAHAEQALMAAYATVVDEPKAEDGETTEPAPAGATIN